MSRIQSDATRLRHATAEIKGLKAELAGAKAAAEAYRARATKAEQEAKEWKGRFDILLRREEPKPAD